MVLARNDFRLAFTGFYWVSLDSIVSSSELALHERKGFDHWFDWLGRIGLLSVITGFYWILLGFTRFSWVLLGLTKVVAGNTRFYWVLLRFDLIALHEQKGSDHRWVSLNLTRHNFDLLGRIGLLLVITGFYWVLLGFTGFYLVFMSFHEFYWVAAGSTRFYLVFVGFLWVSLGFTWFSWILLFIFLIWLASLLFIVTWQNLDWLDSIGLFLVFTGFYWGFVPLPSFRKGFGEIFSAKNVNKIWWIKDIASVRLMATIDPPNPTNRVLMKFSIRLISMKPSKKFLILKSNSKARKKNLVIVL